MSEHTEPGAAPLIVGMTADSVKARLGLPEWEEDISFKESRRYRWHYPEGLVIRLRDGGDGLKVTAWTWKGTHCPKCGEEFAEGVTRCWASGCDYVLPVSLGIVPFVELPDGRTVMAQWTELPRGICAHGSEWKWTLTLEGQAFRLFDRKYGTWSETFGYGTKWLRYPTCSQAPDGRFVIRYGTVVDGYYESVFVNVELLFDVEKMEVEYGIEIDLD